MKVVISAGPTREPIDAVRFITNRSSGKMGYALVRAALKRGLQVVLVSGPVCLPVPESDNLEFIQVEKAAEMAIAVKTAAVDAQLVIMSAAVADYRPVKVIAGKMKKSFDLLTVTCERTEDILASLGAVKVPGQILCGFAAESDNLLTNAQEKLQRKNLDWIVANDISRNDRGFGSDKNAVTMLSARGEKVELALADKDHIATEIIGRLLIDYELNV